ncbi:unnamed protein product [Brachionus calyciflorus]|uniref:CRIB domain-containing protein n=1 Tax=Brachionus calyciflorus TaxID=104777 RepID=A0A813M5P5_9BILA|nr:unnamed protein product [Brachionus calyciflorus]
MDYNIDTLRHSFDNILKELDDICKSIDDLGDFEQTVNNKKPPIDNKKYKNYQIDYKYNNESSRKDLDAEKIKQSIHKLNNFELKSNLYRKSRLPDDKKTTPSLSKIIGSAHECTANLLMKEKLSSPLTTTTKITKIIQNQASFIETEIPNYEDVDYLQENERVKIASFYNSMGCYVFVSNCTAELYQLKREDEFDSLEIDPVKDYYLFMKNKQGQHSYDDEFDNDDSKSIVNFMYINSGVPVIIFNSTNKIRKKDLRIVLAERSTGFCMFEFKFDSSTEYENSEQTSVFRLTQTNYLPSKNASTNTLNLNYQNEFFDKFFNCKKRHAFKEHFLKFSIRKYYDEFYNQIKKILNDKKNSFFHSNYAPSKSRVNSSNQLNEIFGEKNHHKSNNSLNSVNSIIDTYQSLFARTINYVQSPSLIICHFNLETPVETKPKIGCLKKNCSFASLDTEKVTSPKLEKKHSVSTSNVAPFNFDKNKYSLRRQNTVTTVNTEETQNPQPSLSKSVFNLDEFKLVDNGKNLFKNFLLKSKKLKKSDISDPVNFNHVSHLDKPVAIGKRYNVNYY